MESQYMPFLAQFRRPAQNIHPVTSFALLELEQKQMSCKGLAILLPRGLASKSAPQKKWFYGAVE